MCEAVARVGKVSVEAEARHRLHTLNRDRPGRNLRNVKRAELIGEHGAVCPLDRDTCVVQVLPGGFVLHAARDRAGG